MTSLSYTLDFAVGGPLWRNHGEFHKIILNYYHSIQILIRLKLLVLHDFIAGFFGDSHLRIIVILFELKVENLIFDGSDWIVPVLMLDLDS